MNRSTSSRMKKLRGGKKKPYPEKKKWSYQYAKAPHPSPLLDLSSALTLAVGKSVFAGHATGLPSGMGLRVRDPMRMERFVKRDEGIKVPMHQSVPKAIHGLKYWKLVPTPTTEKDAKSYEMNPILRMTTYTLKPTPDQRDNFYQIRYQWKVSRYRESLRGEDRAKMFQNRVQRQWTPSTIQNSSRMLMGFRACPEAFVNRRIHDDLFLVPYVPSFRRGRMMVMSAKDVTSESRRLFMESFHHLREQGWKTRFFKFKQRVSGDAARFDLYQTMYEKEPDSKDRVGFTRIDGVFRMSMKAKIPSVTGTYYGIGVFKPMAPTMPGERVVVDLHPKVDPRTPGERRDLRELSQRYGLGTWPTLFSWWRPHSVLKVSLPSSQRVNFPYRSVYGGELIPLRRKQLEKASPAYHKISAPFDQPPLNGDGYLKGWKPHSDGFKWPKKKRR